MQNEDKNQQPERKNSSTREEEPRPQYMRLKVSTKELINELAEADQKTQDDFLESLLTFYQLEKAKELVPGKKDIVTELGKHLGRINSIVVDLFEHNVNMREIIHDEFKEQLKKLENQVELKEAGIEKLRDEKIRLIEEKEGYKESLDKKTLEFYDAKQLNYRNEDLIREYKEKIDAADHTITELKEKQEFLDEQLKELGLDATQLIKEYRENKAYINSLTEENAKLVDSIKEKDSLSADLQLQIKSRDIEIEGLSSRLEFLKNELNNKDKTIEDLRTEHKQELSEIRKEHREELQGLMAGHKEEILEINKKHRLEISRLDDKIKELKTNVRIEDK